MATVFMGVIRYSARHPAWVALALATCIGLGLAAHPIYVLGVQFGIWQPLARSRGVSPAARYVSRIEDGTWFDCSVDVARDVHVCKAWDDKGLLLASGDFRLGCQAHAAPFSDLHASDVSVGEGRAYAIYLFGSEGAHSKTLVPVSGNCKGECPEVTISYPDQASPNDQPQPARAARKE
jgi:hypothetical protein